MALQHSILINYILIFLFGFIQHLIKLSLVSEL